jgi:hypothetical protein
LQHAEYNNSFFFSNRADPVDLQEEFDNIEDLSRFTLMKAQFEGTCALVDIADKWLKEAQDEIENCRVKYFRNDEETEKCIKKARELLLSASKEYEKSSGLFKKMMKEHILSKIENIATMKEGGRGMLDYCTKKKRIAESLIIATKQIESIELPFRAIINQERRAFARTWKTFVERSGGVLGWSTFLTILNHYSTVVYLHIFALFCIFCLVLDLPSLIERDDFVGSFIRLVDVEKMLSYDETIFVVAGASLALFLFIFLLNLFLPLRRLGRFISVPSFFIHPFRYSSTRFLGFLLWACILISYIVLVRYVIIGPVWDKSEQIAQNSWGGLKIFHEILYWIPALIL